MSCPNCVPLSAKSRIQGLVNNPTNVVRESLYGMVMVHNGLVLLEGCNAVLRRDYNDLRDKVKIVSGGAAGNEPSHAGFVGPGMLTAAISGNLFAAPSSDTILRVIEELGTNHAPGILMIVQNYTGHRINFALAKLRAKNRGFKVKMILVADDVCLKTFEKTAGPRGLAGILFLQKVAGAMAEAGKNLQEIYENCNRILSEGRISTVSVCTKVPFPVGSCACTEDRMPVQMEIGYGIHGEPGVLRIHAATARSMISKLLETMGTIAEENRGSLQFDQELQSSDKEVAIMINNLGGSSQLEINIIVLEAMRQLAEFGIKVKRAYVGTLMTSLDTCGFQLTLLKILSDEDLIKYLDAPTVAPAWPNVFDLNDAESKNIQRTLTTTGIYEKTVSNDKIDSTGPTIQDGTARVLLTVISFACEALIACMEQLNIMDDDSGDGDCGSTLARGASAIKSAIKKNEICGTRPFVTFRQISEITEKEMGGLQGGLYSLFFDAAAQVFAESSENEVVTACMWLSALVAGNKAIAAYGNASEGDRTMLDPLLAAQNRFAESLGANLHPIRAFGDAVKVAESCAIETLRMSASAGRASLIRCKTFRYPDPGAHAVGIWMRAAYEGIKLKLSCDCEF